MSLQKIHLGKQVQEKTLTFDAVATATARAILAIKIMDNYVQGSATLAVGAGASEVAITPALAAPFRYHDTPDYSDVEGREINLGIFAVKHTEDILTVANANHKTMAKVYLVNAADQSPILDAAGKRIAAYVIVDQGDFSTKLKFYAEEANGDVLAATTFVDAATVAYQFHQRFNFDTLGSDAFSNKKFFTGAADINVTHDLQQLLKDLYGDLGYGFLNTGNGALGTSLLKQLQDHLDPASPTAHDAADINLDAIAGLVDGSSQPVVDVQAAILSLYTSLTANEDNISAHLLDAENAHAASAIAFTGTGSNYMGSATEAAAALNALDAALQAEETAREALQTEVDAIQTGAGLNVNGTYTAPAVSNFLGGATSLKNADELLDTALQAHLDDAAGAHGASAIAVTPAGNLAATNVQDALTELQGDIDAIGTGSLTAMQAEIDAIESAVGLNTDGTLAPYTGTYFIDGETIRDAVNTLDTNLNEVGEDLAVEVSDRLAADAAEAAARAAADTALQGELDATQAGAGLAANGTYAADATTNYLTAATSLKDADKKIDAQVKLNTDAIAAETAARTAADTAMQTEIDATQAGAGLDSDGTYAADATTNFLTAATSLKDADKKLDTALKAANDAAALLQNEVNAVEAGAGLNTDGTYTADATTNYLTAATSLKNADKLLDTQVKANADAIAAASSSVTALQAELDATQAGAGLAVDGTYAADATTNYLTAATSLKNADKLLDTQVKVNADAIAAEVSARIADVNAEEARALAAEAALQTELDATQTGAGLDANGAYTANGAANFIAGATSLKNADDLLDAQVQTVSNDLATETAARIAADTAESTARANADAALQTELNTTQVGAGLETDGTYAADAGTNYLQSALSLKDADDKLDAQIKVNADAIAAEVTNRTNADTALQSELDATQTGAGLGANGAYTADLASNYIDAATSLKNADMLLDAQIKVNADAIAQEALDRDAADTAEATARANADSALQSELDATQASVGLGNDGSFPAVTYALSNYMTAATDMVEADVALDAQIKAVADSVAATATTNGTPVDSEIMTLVIDGITGEEYFVTAFEMVANCIPVMIINGLTHTSENFTVMNYTDGKRRKISFGTTSGLIAGDKAATWYRKV